MKLAAAAFFGLLVFAILVGLIVAGPVMLLWNYCLVDAVSGVKEITFLQAWGLYVLSNFLFKTNITKKD